MRPAKQRSGLLPPAGFIAALVFAFLTAWTAANASEIPADPRPGEPPTGAWALCADEIAKTEAAAHIPSQLLTAISKVESGRWDATTAANLAWPWTVTAEGEGRYLPTKAAAIAEVKRLRAAGVRNIDVGCMQVNLQYHPDAFDSLEQAFDPAENVAYAAQFLLELKTEQQSWIKAVGSYHSRTPGNFTRYRAKVFAAWREERKAERERERALADAQRKGLVEALNFRHAGPVPASTTAWAE
jgi:Transglycosylase SLT domain